MVINVDEIVGRAITKVAEDIGANCIVSVGQKRQEQYDEESLYLEVIVTIFKQVKKGVYKKISYESSIKKLESGSVLPIKELVMEGITRNHIEKNDKVVCLVDESVGMGYKSLIFIFEVGKIFFNISTKKLAENIDPNVIESIIDIAREIGKEGREGRKIGTAFVVGDKTEILRYTKQLIINPFSYSDNPKKITDPTIRDTIKEFAQLDGVFIIDKEGTIVSTGSYLNVDTTDIGLPGLGTRHRTCAAITRLADCVSVVVSQSGGKVTVFKSGKMIMKL